MVARSSNEEVMRTYKVGLRVPESLLEKQNKLVMELEVLNHVHKTIKGKEISNLLAVKIPSCSGKTKETYQITYTEAKKLINKVRSTYNTTELFGQEKDRSFESSISTIYQTHDGQDLYPTLEEKAAHLLYFITKNHSFTDGNKRIAAFIFIYFLDRNGILYDSDGNKTIDDNALVALTLMIAVSDPEEKDTLIKIIVNLINKNAP